MDLAVDGALEPPVQRAMTAPMTASSLAALQTRLGHVFRDPALLDLALTHTSAVEAGRPDYQRLEFLGDRVLGLTMADMLYRAFPDAPEGELAQRFNAVVRRETCAAVARDLDLGSHLKLGAGERQTGGRQKMAILADACEAVIAAIHLDAGFEAARAFVERQFGPRIAEAPSAALRDAKTTLQEWLQGQGRPAPRYRLSARSGPDHDPVFIMAVDIDGLEAARGTGRSKREAEQAAAQRYLTDQGLWTETDA
jgi:ribonuclease-3